MLLNPAHSDELTTRVRLFALMPLAKARQWDEAALTYRRLNRGMAGDYWRLEDHGVMAEFCALTGNLSEGTTWLGQLGELDNRKRPLATMEYAAAATVLAGRLGWIDTEQRMRALATDLAAKFDLRNGTTACGDRIRGRLEAEPLLDFLPLYPTSRPPIPAPPMDLGDEELLDRAEQHDLRCEPDDARMCLSRVREGLPQPLRARRDEIAAKFFQSPETETVLRRSARIYDEHGDHRRAELTRCWLGLWTAADDATRASRRSRSPCGGCTSSATARRGVSTGSRTYWPDRNATTRHAKPWTEASATPTGRWSRAACWHSRRR